MPNIEYIKNVTASHTFTGPAPGEFSHTITSPPIHPVDEIVIRAITWNGLTNDDSLYLLWSNITNDIIGSFCGANLSPTCSGTRIVLSHPPPNVLEFKLLHPRTKNDLPPIFDDSVEGDIAIHLEFISYKKRHIA